MKANTFFWRRQWHPTPVLLPGKSHGQRSLVGCSPWGRKESDTTEWLPFQLSLSCIGEGNGNPLQCSCLENPRDGGAWWAPIYGVTRSWTRLKQLRRIHSLHANYATNEARCLKTISFNLRLLSLFYRWENWVATMLCNLFCSSIQQRYRPSTNTNLTLKWMVSLLYQ